MATGSFLCEPVAAMCIEPPATPDMGWFLKKKKKSNPQDSIRICLNLFIISCKSVG